MAGWYEEIREIWANGVSTSLPEDEKPGASAARRVTTREDVVCLGCGFVLPPGADECPSCGKVREFGVAKTEISAWPHGADG